MTAPVTTPGRQSDQLRAEAERLTAQGEYRAANAVWTQALKAQSAEILAMCDEIMEAICND